MSVQTKKNLAAEIAPNISSALRDLYMVQIIVILVGFHSKFTVSSWHCHYYSLLDKRFWLGFI